MFSRREWSYLVTILAREDKSDEWIAQAFCKPVAFIRQCRTMPDSPAFEQWCQAGEISRPEMVLAKIGSGQIFWLVLIVVELLRWVNG